MATLETRTVEPDEAGMRLDRWFKTHYPELSFGHLQKLLRSGQIRVDGGRVKTNARLEVGQAVRVPPLGTGGLGGILRESKGDVAPARNPALPRYPGESRSPAEDGYDETPSLDPGFRRDDGEGRKDGEAKKPKRPTSDAAALRAMILYEDDDVFVFNKQQGLAVQGGSGLTKHVDGMLEALRDRKGQKPRLVHRLDRDTSGVLVVARTRLAAQKLTASFRTRSTRKIYWALVMGVPKPKQGRISTWLAREESEERMRVAKHGHRRFQPRHLALLGGRDGRAEACLALDAPDHRPHAPASRPCRAHRPSDHRRPEIFRGGGELGFSRRHPKEAASSRAPYRHSASLQRWHARRDGAAAAAHAAVVEPAWLRRHAGRQRRR